MSYEESLKIAIKEWMKDPIEDEWTFDNFRQTNIESMSSSEAFQSITLTVEYLIAEDDESTAIEILQTIIDLANHCNTTEVPPNLSSNKNIIIKKFENYGDYAKDKLKELFDFYRL